MTENPELKFQARSCLPRPFNSDFAQKCDQDLSVVLDRQSDYRDEVSKITGVNILDANMAFCNKDNVCFAVNTQNQLLYADSDHLSVLGSEWQYKKVIEPIYQRRFGR